jgi:hypothetical protein
MGVLEIVLLIIGGVIFAASFVIPVRKEEVSESARTLVKEEIETLVADEMNKIRSHVDDVVDEAVGYAMEKTERSLERLSNEKIMAVNEYSDTVLKEIHRNHEEVMFLYDMLNDKHTNLKNTVSEVNRAKKEFEETQKEVEVTKKEAEAVVQSFQRLAPEAVLVEDGYVVDVKPAEFPVIERQEISAPEKNVDISFTGGSDEESRNCNDRILELYRQGKSKVAIAKELGLGVGEVKLVIDLYRNM